MRHADDPTPNICQGSWDGVISTQRQGEHGFGYDPVFFQPQLNLAAAQLNPEQKHSLSHRGKALRQLMTQFQDLGL
jgi:XTP/dITP diphosphohydrolase